MPQTLDQPQSPNADSTSALDSSGLQNSGLQDTNSRLQKVGAALVTLIALWLLFGIPAFLLFHVFFE